MMEDSAHEQRGSSTSDKAANAKKMVIDVTAKLLDRLGQEMDQAKARFLDESDEEFRREPSWKEIAQRELEQRVFQLLQERNLPTQIDPEAIQNWMDTHGEDAWMRVMTQWEKFSKVVIDEFILPNKDEGEKPQSRIAENLRKLETIANTLSQRLVDSAMDGSRIGRRKRDQNNRND